MSRRRRRSRVLVGDPAVLEKQLAEGTPIGRTASAAGLRLVSVKAWPCADGTLTMRMVWRRRDREVDLSMVETIRSVRLKP